MNAILLIVGLLQYLGEPDYDYFPTKNISALKNKEAYCSIDIARG